jgi:hypothetical protein
MKLFLWNNRRHKRKNTHLEAELISDNQGCAGILDNNPEHNVKNIKWFKYMGIIDNISQGGMSVRTLPSKNTTDYSPGTTHELNIQLFSGEMVKLRCRVKWLQKMQARELINKMGMEIINPPPQYKKLLKLV